MGQRPSSEAHWASASQ